jgi:hypothetical protein
MKKKVVTFLLIMALIVGGTQTYASTVLNSNVIGLIQTGFDSIKSYYIGSTTKDMATTQTQMTTQVDKYVTDRTNQSFTNLNTHKTSEETRASQELNTYLDSLKKQVDSAVTDQEQQAKTVITSEVNKNIASIEDALNQELASQIQSKLKK